MHKLADIVLSYYWFLNFSEDVVDEDAAVREIENLAYTISSVRLSACRRSAGT